MLITFSGSDGAGKTTQINLLIDRLRANHLRVKYFWSRAGYTPGFLAFKRVLRFCLGEKIAPPSGESARRTQMLSDPRIVYIWGTLAIIDLIIYYAIALRYYRWRYDAVVCDRFLPDTHLDFLINHPSASLTDLRIWKTLKKIAVKPDCSFLLTVPVAVSQLRSKQKGEPYPDDEQTLQIRLKNYLDSSLFPVNQYRHLNGMESPDFLSEKIKKHLNLIKPIL